MLCAQVAILRDAMVEELKARGEEEEAKRLAGFKGSKGYIDLWRQRKNLSQIRLCGESGSVDQEQVTLEREKLGDVLDEYIFSDVYNLDETALFYNLSPLKTIGRNGEKGSKLLKERLTVVFITNADGTDKMKPIVIGKRPTLRSNVHSKVYIYLS